MKNEPGTKVEEEPFRIFVKPGVSACE